MCGAFGPRIPIFRHRVRRWTSSADILAALSPIVSLEECATRRTSLPIWSPCSAYGSSWTMADAGGPPAEGIAPPQVAPGKGYAESELDRS